MAVGKILREIMSEPGQPGSPSGTLSWGRVASSIALVAAIVWVSRILYLTHSFPWENLKDITGFTLAPYGSNRIATAVQAFSSNPVNKTSNQ